MKIDFLQPAITRVIQSSKRPRTSDLESIAKEALLQIEHFDWPNLLKGNNLNFGFEAARAGVGEQFFVSQDWSPEQDHYGWSKGSDWPAYGGLRRSFEKGIVVRSIGRSAKYLSLVADDLKQRSSDASWVAEAYRVVEDASKANTRARKARSTKHLPSVGGTVTGTELQQERTLIARAGDGCPLAIWTVGLSMFFPNTRPPAAEDFVPVLQIDVLSAWEGCHPHAELDQSFCAMFSNLVLRALDNVGQYLSTNEIFDDCSVDLPFAVKIRLLPSMGGMVAKVGGALAQLFDDDGFCDGLNDSHARIWWLDVEIAQEDVAAQRAEAQATQAQAQELKEAQKASLMPGDEFTLVAVEPKEFCRGGNGRLYPTHFAEWDADHKRNFDLSPAALLEIYGLVANEINEIEGWINQKAACSRAINELGHGHEPDDMDALLAAAAKLAVVGLIKPAPKSILFVLKDEATGAQVASLGLANSSIVKFLQAATTIPERGGAPAPRPNGLDPTDASPLDPGRVTLAAAPRRLKVAKSLLAEHPQIKAWCDNHQVELVHPKSGFDSVGTIARMWHDYLRNAVFYRTENELAGHSLDELSDWLKGLCFVINDCPEDLPHWVYYSVKRADARFIPWRDALVAKAWGLGSKEG